MGRTAAPATPGTDPNAPATPADPAAEIAGALAETAEVKEAVTLADALAMIASLQSQVQTLGRNQVAQAVPEKVKLPELAAVMKQKPDIPVLTQGGWYVPSVLPSQRKVD